jgi:hypothetical protein
VDFVVSVGEKLEDFDICERPMAKNVRSRSSREFHFRGSYCPRIANAHGTAMRNDVSFCYTLESIRDGKHSPPTNNR